MSKKVFAVTGATGNVGGQLAERLLAEGHTVRAIARGGRRLQTLAGRGADPRPGSVNDVRFLTDAFRGADAVFALVPPDYTSEVMRDYQRSIADAETAAIRAAEVPRVVALSSVGAQHEKGTGPIAGLHYFEKQLGALPDVHVVFLRAAFFMENFLQNIDLIKSRGINGGPAAPNLPVPMIATKDIAAAGAALLSTGDFTGKSVRYVLGPRDLTFVGATRILGDAIGKPGLQFVQFSYEDTRKGLIEAGISRSVADAFTEMYRGFNEGLVRPTEVRSKRNTTPTTFEEWSRTFAAAYRAPAGAA